MSRARHGNRSSETSEATSASGDESRAHRASAVRRGALAKAPAARWYRIGEVAEIVGEKPSVLRYWETEFSCVRPQKSRSGQRVYAQRDVDALLRIRSLLKERRFTIEGAK
ncbi:MAG: MerR family transcriptional regulator [Polyangiaceae bacterium]